MPDAPLSCPTPVSNLGDGVVSHLRSLMDWPDLSGTRYEVVRPIGFGGMATIFLARDALLNRDVAIKVQASSLANDGSIDRLSGASGKSAVFFPCD